MAESLSITDPADFHVHLRQGTLSELVTPHVRKGGFSTAYVMVEIHSGPLDLPLITGILAQP